MRKRIGAIAAMALIAGLIAPKTIGAPALGRDAGVRKLRAAHRRGMKVTQDAIVAAHKRVFEKRQIIKSEIPKAKAAHQAARGVAKVQAWARIQWLRLRKKWAFAEMKFLEMLMPSLKGKEYAPPLVMPTPRPMPAPAPRPAPPVPTPAPPKSPAPEEPATLPVITTALTAPPPAIGSQAEDELRQMVAQMLDQENFNEEQIYQKASALGLSRDAARSIIEGEVLARTEMPQKNVAEYLADLGLPPTATLADARKAYRRLAMQLHPDRQPATAAPEERAAAEEKFKIVDEAYKALQTLMTGKPVAALPAPGMPAILPAPTVPVRPTPAILPAPLAPPRPFPAAPGLRGPITILRPAPAMPARPTLAILPAPEPAQPEPTAPSAQEVYQGTVEELNELLQKVRAGSIAHELVDAELARLGAQGDTLLRAMGGQAPGEHHRLINEIASARLGSAFGRLLGELDELHKQVNEGTIPEGLGTELKRLVLQGDTLQKATTGQEDPQNAPHRQRILPILEGLRRHLSAKIQAVRGQPSAGTIVELTSLYEKVEKVFRDYARDEAHLKKLLGFLEASKAALHRLKAAQS